MRALKNHGEESKRFYRDQLAMANQRLLSLKKRQICNAWRQFARDQSNLRLAAAFRKEVLQAMVGKTTTRAVKDLKGNTYQVNRSQNLTKEGLPILRENESVILKWNQLSAESMLRFFDNIVAPMAEFEINLVIDHGLGSRAHLLSTNGPWPNNEQTTGD